MLGRKAPDEGMSMVSRRGVLGGVAALAAVALSGCGGERRKLAEAAQAAAVEIDGVSGAELESEDGANFERALRGTLTLETEDHAAGLAVFDEAMRAIVTVVHDELGEPEAESLRVGWITAVLANGGEITAMELEPDMQAATPRLDRITAGSFYAKYGLG